MIEEEIDKHIENITDFSKWYEKPDIKQEQHDFIANKIVFTKRDRSNSNDS